MAIGWEGTITRPGEVIGRKDFWGKNYGSDAAEIRTRYAFEVLGLRLLLAEVLAGNERSLGMLGRVGYREVGRIPGRYWKRGACRDAVILVRERDRTPE